MARAVLAAALLLAVAASQAQASRNCPVAVAGYTGFFGTGSKRDGDRYLSQLPAWQNVGDITKLQLFYSGSIGCVLGIRPTYGPGAGEAQLIGSERGLEATALELDPGEHFVKAEHRGSRCLEHIKLTTSEGRTLSAGNDKSPTVAKAVTPPKQGAYLASFRGFVDGISGGLQQLQIVWGVTNCRHAAAPATAAPDAPPRAPPAAPPSFKSPPGRAAPAGGAGAGGGAGGAEAAPRPGPNARVVIPSIVSRPINSLRVAPAHRPALPLPVRGGGAAASDGAREAAEAAAGAEGLLLEAAAMDGAPEADLFAAADAAADADAPPAAAASVGGDAEGLLEAAPVSPPEVAAPRAGLAPPARPGALAAAEPPPVLHGLCAPRKDLCDPEAAGESGPVCKAVSPFDAPSCLGGCCVSSGKCRFGSCSANGLGDDIQLGCYGTNEMRSPLSLLGNRCGRLACKLSVPGCKTALLGGNCVGTVVATQPAAQLHPEAARYLGYPCIETIPTAGLVQTPGLGLSRGLPPREFVMSAWKVCDCGASKVSAAGLGLGGLRLPRLPHFSLPHFGAPRWGGLRLGLGGRGESPAPAPAPAPFHLGAALGGGGGQESGAAQDAPAFDDTSGDPSLAATSGRIGAIKDLMLGGMGAGGDGGDPFGAFVAMEGEDLSGGEELQAVSAYEVPIEDSASTLDKRTVALYEAGARPRRGAGGGGGFGGFGFGSGGSGREELAAVSAVPVEVAPTEAAPVVSFDESGAAPTWGGAEDPFAGATEESGVAPAREGVVDADANADGDALWGGEESYAPVETASAGGGGHEGFLFATAEPVPLERRR
ncbi:hypothetical protein Rsub_01077 [Raphidocelis subcapitata]|uniref:Jacalin-type lectin domain-containing protein n=1 Tax=Raphidocelis subcapitata TaxID=307507 RepID=A0A2V0NU58_9CHLO|nr:hypothetical protein Rsub_01077 [Raphidocelis subcapitata]|eukprot:GBF88365.1 hypothetical protein Rsub_01077 [Raphidocelis subcapitata]